MTREDYLKKTAEISKKKQALKAEQEMLDELYIKHCAPYVVGTKLKVREKDNNNTFVCWVVGYQVRCNELVLICNKAKQDGERSKRENVYYIDRLELEACAE